MRPGADASRGITLLEASIVLTVAALLVAAVMGGRQLIEQARRDKFVTTVNRLERSFWDFYDAQVPKRIPGDPSPSDGVVDSADAVFIDLYGAELFVLHPVAHASDPDGAGPHPPDVLSIEKLDGVTYRFSNNNGSGAAGTFNTLELLDVPSSWAERLDGVIDGTVSAAGGRVRRFTGAGSAAQTNPDATANAASGFEHVVYYLDRTP